MLGVFIYKNTIFINLCQSLIIVKFKHPGFWGWEIDLYSLFDSFEILLVIHLTLVL